MYKISVITVNLNNIDGLKRTVESVIGQDFDNYEYIVIDGGSTDGSKEYIETISRVNYWVSEPDKGIYNAMNTAITIAKGEYCIFMNSGDYFFDNKILSKVAPMLNGGDFYVGCPLYLSNGKAISDAPPCNMSIEYLLYSGINHQSTFTRTALLKESPYDENYKIVADYEKFFSEWYLNGRTYNYIDLTISFYMFDGLSSVNRDLLEKERKIVIDKILYKDKDKDKNKKKEEITTAKEYKIDENLLLFKQKLTNSESLSTIKRDLKILRNAVKLFFKDLFYINRK